MGEEGSYNGRDLEAMSFAVNYHRWILNFLRPYLGTRLVEVGAGTGLFSELLLGPPAESLSLVEPSAAMHRILRNRIQQVRPSMKVEIYNTTFVEVAEPVKARQQPDSILYINVMEHIPDDVIELKAVWRTLGQDGRAFIFVPALPWLYGNFDVDVGHHRRYTKLELEDKCLLAGFKIIKSMYFDLAGVAPWWIQFRLLGASALNPRGVKLYDSLVMPITKAIESIIPPPWAKTCS